MELKQLLEQVRESCTTKQKELCKGRQAKDLPKNEQKELIRLSTIGGKIYGLISQYNDIELKVTTLIKTI